MDHEFGGGDGLSDVALGVFGDVDEQSSEGGGQLAFSDYAGLFQVGVGESADALRGAGEGSLKFEKERVAFGMWGRFGLEGAGLSGCERLAFRIGEQTIKAARDVAEVKGDGRDVADVGVQLGGVQA